MSIFVNKCNLLYENQMALELNIQMYTTLFNIIDQISALMDSTIFSIGIFLFKAFDTIDHNVKKASRFCIREMHWNGFL